MGRAVLVIATLALLAGGSWAQKQCGGSHNCNGHSACGDAAWTDVTCAAPAECVRKNAELWECVAPEAAGTGAAAGAGAGAKATAGAGAPREYPVLTSGRRNASAPATKACACVDVGLNDGACFLGVTTYCEGTPGEPAPNMTVCEAMSGFFNFQNVTAAKIAAEFFVRACALTVPEKPSACGCLEGPNTESCRAMTIHACLLGNSMCPALAFGPEADQAAHEAQARYMNQNCGGALTAAQVGLNFTDMTKETFVRKYSQGVAAALAVISGQTLPSVILLPPTQIKTGSLAGSSPAPAGRRLAQANLKTVEKVLTTYQIRSSAAEAPEVLSRLRLAAENGGEGLYKALAANGVPLRPSYSIENGPPLVGAIPRRTPLRYVREPLEAGEIAGIVIGSVAGAALLAAAVAFGVKYLRRSRAAKAGAAGAGAAAPAKGAAQGAAGAPGTAANGDKSAGGDRVVDVAAAAEAGAARG